MTQKEFTQANKAAEALAQELYKRKTESNGILQISQQERDILLGYSGSGGLNTGTGSGVLDEFYTPKYVVRKMWDLAYANGFTPDQMVLEPSCGIGAFIEHAPDPSKVVAYEISEVSSKIAKLLHPAATIRNESFEANFIEKNRSIGAKLMNTKYPERFGLVIGNPPYKKYESIYAGMGEKAYTRAIDFMNYFMIRGLDVTEPEGLLIYIIGAVTMNGGTPFIDQIGAQSICKREILKRASFVGAYRLWNNVFERTDVLPDIVIFRKK